jgi:EAL domain-containing protein (putative c-di-GMP-specific phosphodiesterase class I)
MTMEHRLKVLSIEAIGKKAPRVRSRLAVNLGAAIAHHEVAVHFQPQYDLRGGTVCGFEALARWCGSDGKVTPPSTFIPIAERFGLIGEMGVTVLHQACAAMAMWQSDGPEPTLSVNISPKQINGDFCALIANVLDITNFPAERLELEITESALMTRSQLASGILELCKQIGVRIALDDFGIGYSSLAHLALLPIDRLKLDRSFTQRLTRQPKTVVIVRSVLNMARDLGVDVIAEGIETEEELAILLALGCSFGQGNLLSRSLPVDPARAQLLHPWGNRFANTASELDGTGGLHAA